MVFRGSRPPHSQIPLPGGEDEGRSKRGSRTVPALSAALVVLSVFVVFLLVLR
jgi:hypothetical protein